jgi:hypothetical protein
VIVYLLPPPLFGSRGIRRWSVLTECVADPNLINENLSTAPPVVKSMVPPTVTVEVDSVTITGRAYPVNKYGGLKISASK